jgi:hypothetical protein
VNHTEHPAKTPSPRTGLFATLRGLLPANRSGASSASRSDGSGAPSHLPARRCRYLTSAGLLALTLMAAPSLAAAAPGPPTVTTFAVHGFHEGNIRLLGSVEPNKSDTQYWFEFGKTTAYDDPTSPTPTLDAGSEGTAIVGQDLTGLEPGSTYHFRITATNSSLGNPVVHGEDRTLTVPVPGQTVSGEELSQPNPCPNEALRAGPSAHLPDCRAYEQLTPAEKGGAQDINQFNTHNTDAVSGLDGDHFILYETFAKWGKDVGGAINASYTFARTPAGWQMIPTTRQPQAGVFTTQPSGNISFTPDLTQLLLARSWVISEFSQSPNEEFLLGPPGGPYTTAATIPRVFEGGFHNRWKVQSRDGTLAVLQSSDHELIPGHPTGTTGGSESDLYAYAEGHLDQLNVDSAGQTIGNCGALPVRGYEVSHTPGALEQGRDTSINDVSSDGSHVFFNAGFGTECPGERELEGGGPRVHLYMREPAAARTVDIGPYAFVGANPAGTRVILLNATGEYLLYRTQTEAAEPLPHELDGQPPLLVSEDGNVLYLGSDANGEGGSIARYEIATETYTFIDNLTGESNAAGGGYFTSPDGSQFYFVAGHVGGFPGGEQLYRYDSTEEAVECVTCASPFDPEPNYPPALSTGTERDRVSPLTFPASANGDYLFFETPSALLPKDINGEIEPPGIQRYSLSSDVYEWRRNGIDGCDRIQGCLALITDGIDATKNELVGTTPSGRDVFFLTGSQLTPTDHDTNGDVYDARIGGGFPVPRATVECEGDACSHPVPAPNDPTPSSEQFHGAGNEHPLNPKHHKRHHRGKHHKRSHSRAGRKGGGAK